MARQKNTELREKIIMVAYKLFYTKGYDKIKMIDIARECDISKSLLQHYFPKKDNLIIEIFNGLIERSYTYVETQFPEIMEDKVLANSIFYHLYYELLTRDNNKLLKMYHVILGNTDLLCQACDFAFKQAYANKSAESMNDKLSDYIINGAFSQLFTLYLNGRLLLSVREIVNIALLSHYRFLEYPQKKIDNFFTIIDQLLTQEKIDFFITSYKEEVTNLFETNE